MKPKFQFGNVVVIDKDKIGLICKTWQSSLGDNSKYNYDVYVRSYNQIQNFTEAQIKHYVFHKELIADEFEFYQ